MKYGPQRNWRHIASNKTMRMPIKDGRPRVNTKPYRPNICTVQLKGQIFGQLSIRVAPCKRSLRFPEIVNDANIYTIASDGRHHRNMEQCLHL